MELREELADSPSTARLAELRSDNESRLAAAVAETSAAFARNDLQAAEVSCEGIATATAICSMYTVTDCAFQHPQKALNKMSYWRTIQEEIEKQSPVR